MTNVPKAADFGAAVEKTSGIGWLMVKDLKKGDRLDLRTKEKFYKLELIDVANFHVRLYETNDEVLLDVPELKIVGTTLSGGFTSIKMGAIATGLNLVCYIEGVGECMLPRTKQILLNGKPLILSSEN